MKPSTDIDTISIAYGKKCGYMVLEARAEDVKLSFKLEQVELKDYLISLAAYIKDKAFDVETLSSHRLTYPSTNGTDHQD